MDPKAHEPQASELQRDVGHLSTCGRGGEDRYSDERIENDCMVDFPPANGVHVKLREARDELEAAVGQST